MDYPGLHRRSLEDPHGFWADAASAIDWVDQPRSIHDPGAGRAGRWFGDGTLNTCFNAVDRHVLAGRGDQLAVIHDSPVTGQQRRLTFSDLREEVAVLAGALRREGVVHGDRVLIYKPLLDRALELASHRPRCQVILRRPQAEAQLGAADRDWAEFVAGAQAADCQPVAATDPLYVLYTSGTTGRPKGVVRDHGGHAVALAWSMANVYGARPGDVFWAASDIGWVVGHSYIVYGPLLHGCTTVLYEGKPVATPDAGAFWRVIEDHGAQTLFTAPTAIRAIKREDPHGEHLRPRDTSALRHLFLAGERTDPDTLRWAADLLRVPVIDHWWQTETGWPITSTCVGLDATQAKVGSPGRPVPGYDVAVLDDGGAPLGPGEEGAIALRLPLPPGTLPTLWGDDERFVRSYLARFPGFYATGDGGFVDEEGYLFVMGRTDDVINVAGHRLSTGAMEEILAAHPDVAECAVVAVQDPLKGHVPVGLVVVKSGSDGDQGQIEAELIARVRDQIGAVAAFKRALVVERLPKTRSGKILRDTMRRIADGRDYDIPSTIDDPQILREIHEAFAARASTQTG